jgi:hypothetical protein
VAYNFQIQKSTSNGGGGGGGHHHNVVGHNNIQRCRSHTHDETSAMMLHHRHSSSSGSAGNLNINNDATSVSAERSFKGIRYRPRVKLEVPLRFEWSTFVLRRLDQAAPI